MIDTGHLLSLVGLTFMLGLRHGMDPDHLAVVDNITRFNASNFPQRARWCGLFFSLGHGAMVTLVAALLAVASGARMIPGWVEIVGQSISIGFLIAVGGLNLHALLRADGAGVAAPRGLKSALFGRFTRVSHPLAVSLIGAAFAISMDTLSQAAVFSLAASGRFAWTVALLLGAVFTLGMLAVDTANGLWVQRMIGALDGRVRVRGRYLTLAIAFLSLGLAATGILRLGHSGLDSWVAGHGLVIGAASVLLLSAIFAAAHLRRGAAGRALR